MKKNNYFQVYLGGDRSMWLIVLLLFVCSLLAVYSASGILAYSGGGSVNKYLFTHFVMLVGGMMFTYLSFRVHYMQFNKLAPVLLVGAVVLLVYTFFFGINLNDARRWVQIPVVNISFQSSDFAKLALIIYVSRMIAIKQDVIKEFKGGFLPVFIPIVLVCALIAPADLSSAALLFLVCLIMMFVGRVHMKYIFFLIVAGLGVLAFIFFLGTVFPDFIRSETWISRINEFIHNSDGGWQIQQSKIAIARGEIWGAGPGNSMQRNFLPYPYADFIYAIICEEYGLVGAFLIISLYLWLLYRTVVLVVKSPKTFGSMLAIGLALSLVIQALANMAVSVHLLPVTGLNLPLISRGGSNMLFTCIALGIILSVSRNIEQRIKSEKLRNG